ncbi:Fe-S oxidoreductase [Candidatus Scalindua japonica]|uniref:Fe-S oxidoreductase n=1 Tax=Candidatus Scalindua japonica TaxID=1284222 RepID=A0A286TTG3_9BACT|nr:radical SAM protein [Candidatus Scalindua japonica]GAX59144.1 Fe-S oxidoreductase [Candidatus Scalindua japonica]
MKKNIKKLLLVEPSWERTKRYWKKSKLFGVIQPIRLGYIAALTPGDWEVEVIDENVESFIYKDASLVGITSFTHNALRAYEIASVYRNKNIQVVMGGVHASMMPEEALNYVDSVVVGEAETVWGNLIKDFESGNLKREYLGGYPPLEGLIQPRRDIFSDDYFFGIIQTSRGCSVGCEFCSVTELNGRKHRQRPVNEVLDELETIPQKIVFFIDDNIIGYGRNSEQRAIRLFKGLIERKLNKRWFSQSTVNFGNNEEILYYARKSGCVGIFLGIESVSKDVLKGMRKGVNINTDYYETIKRIHKYGILVSGNIMIGNDEDTEETYKANAEFVIKANIDIPSLSNVVPQPGTRLFKRLIGEGRLKYSNFPEDWKYYDWNSITIKPRYFTEEFLIRSNKRIYGRIFSIPRIAIRFVKTLIYCRSFFLAVVALRLNIVLRGFNKKIGFS